MRFSGEGQAYHGLVRMTSQGPKWTGRVDTVPSKLREPLAWRRPRMVFVNSMSDLFHPDVPTDYIDQVFAVMALARQHSFQVLTKRAGRMRQYLDAPQRRTNVMAAANEIAPCSEIRWPLPNVWLGVSAEDQLRADERMTDLLMTPAAVRFVSVEPMLGAIDLTALRNLFALSCCGGQRLNALTGNTVCERCGQACGCGNRLDWVICGGESGHGARWMEPCWARSLRDQCAAARVPFFFKQWGAWLPRERDGQPDEFINVGKRVAGRLLDGCLYDARPQGVEKGGHA